MQDHHVFINLDDLSYIMNTNYYTSICTAFLVQRNFAKPVVFRSTILGLVPPLRLIDRIFHSETSCLYTDASPFHSRIHAI